jgi:hypothetical protein
VTSLAVVAAPGLLDAADVVPSFPPPLDRYQGEAGLSLWEVLAHRVRVEPGFTPEMRAIVSACFLAFRG